MSDEEAVRHAFKGQFLFTTNWGRVVMMRSNGSQTILGENWMEARANIAPVVMTLTISAQDSMALLQALVQHIRNAATTERANQSRDLLSTLVRQLDQHGHAIPLWASRELQERIA